MTLGVWQEQDSGIAGGRKFVRFSEMRWLRSYLIIVVKDHLTQIPVDANKSLKHNTSCSNQKAELSSLMKSLKT